MRNSSGTILGTQAYATAKIGGLGYVTGMTIAADGTCMGCRTDVGGAYRRESSAAAWTQIITADHMTIPGYPGPLGLGHPYGCFELAIAPSDAAIWYMGFRGRMLRSANRGVDWTDDSLNGSTGLYMGSNDQTGGNVRLIASKLKVDPSNSAIAYFGSQANGLWQRLSGAWANIASVPAPILQNAARVIVIAIDPTSSLVGSGATSRRSIVYATSSGSGIYKSTDGGTTFSLLADTSQFNTGTAVSCTTNSTTTITTASTAGFAFGQAISGANIPAGAYIVSVTNATTFVISAAATSSTTLNLTITAAFKVWFMDCDAAGKLWVCVDNGGGSNVWTYSAGAWSNLTMTGITSVVRSLRVDPKDATRIVGQAESGCPIRSLDSAATWKLWNTVNQASTAPDVPIIASVLNATFGGGFSASFADVIPHPTAAYDYVPMGLGVCRFANPWPTLPSTSDRLIWLEFAAGIEELVANDILVTPDGDVICSSQDKALIRLNGSGYPPSSHPASSLDTGFGADYAIDNHQWLYGIANNQLGGYQSAKSTDGGRNWTITVQPSTRLGGCVAVGNAGNVVVFPGQNAYPKYTTDSGTTWNTPTFTGWTPPAEGTENGWGFGTSATRRHIVVADKANPGTFYAYNYKDLSGNSMGLWKSTDSGATWARVNTTSIINPLYSGFHVNLKMAPNGDMFLSTGIVSNVYDNTTDAYMMKSTDGGGTWAQVPQISEINNFAIGKPAPGSSTPYTLYALAWKAGTYGAYRSLDGGATWAAINNNPTFDDVYAMDADRNIFGRFFNGRTGTGYDESNYSYKLRLKAA
jgi:xyloglucan-specific exo-beta-1,4-glucanase